VIFEYIDVDNSRKGISLDKVHNADSSWKTVDGENKLEFIKNFFAYYDTNQKMVLFDKNHKQLVDFYEKNDIDSFDEIKEVNENSKILFFTSGSSGFPLGAFKSRENLQKEVKALAILLENSKMKKVVVTVPFVHIYGILAGLLLPRYLDDITLVVKDEFLPYELINEALEGDTLFITTPVFIKALLRVQDSTKLKNSLFISSTAPLESSDAKEFESKFDTKLLQLFGSTETGGIAYKVGDSTIWKALLDVKLSQNDDKLNVNSPYISKYTIKDKIKKLDAGFQTEDIIEIDGDSFKLLGRSNKIIKIAGKRISSMQIETILEQIYGVKRAIVTLVYKKDMFKSEQIKITLESIREIKKAEIKESINNNFGTLSIPFSVSYVEKINYSAMGKKVIF